MTDQTEEPKDEPDIGKPFSEADFDLVMDTVRERQAKKPEEPATLSLYFVLTNIGEKYRKVQCIEQEFECFKKDIVLPEEGPPTCPNGHSLHEGPGLTLGWVWVD